LEVFIKSPGWTVYESAKVDGEKIQSVIIYHFAFFLGFFLMLLAAEKRRKPSPHIRSLILQPLALRFSGDGGGSTL
jgi:hypothetical protein